MSLAEQGGVEAAERLDRFVGVSRSSRSRRIVLIAGAIGVLPSLIGRDNISVSKPGWLTETALHVNMPHTDTGNPRERAPTAAWGCWLGWVTSTRRHPLLHRRGPRRRPSLFVARRRVEDQDDGKKRRRRWWCHQSGRAGREAAVGGLQIGAGSVCRHSFADLTCSICRLV